MKLAISLLALATLAVVTDAAHAPSGRTGLNVGYVYTGDKLLYRGYLYRPAVPNSIQTQDLVYRGNYTTRISAVRAMEVGYSQYAQPWILQGGVGYNSVTVRVQSARGYGYYYNIEVWGR